MVTKDMEAAEISGEGIRKVRQQPRSLELLELHNQYRLTNRSAQDEAIWRTLKREVSKNKESKEEIKKTDLKNATQID